MFKGLAGLLMLFAGIYFIWAALFGATFWGVLGGTLGVDTSLCLGFYVFLAILGIPMVYLGANWFFTNENGFLRLMIGLGGIITMIFAVVIALLGIIAAPETATISLYIAGISVIFVLALSLAMLDYGFKLKLIPYADKIIVMLKKLVMIKI